MHFKAWCCNMYLWTSAWFNGLTVGLDGGKLHPELQTYLDSTVYLACTGKAW